MDVTMDLLGYMYQDVYNNILDLYVSTIYHVIECLMSWMLYCDDTRLCNVCQLPKLLVCLNDAIDIGLYNAYVFVCVVWFLMCVSCLCWFWYIHTNTKLYMCHYCVVYTIVAHVKFGVGVYDRV